MVSSHDQSPQDDCVYNNLNIRLLANQANPSSNRPVSLHEARGDFGGVMLWLGAGCAQQLNPDGRSLRIRPAIDSVDNNAQHPT